MVKLNKIYTKTGDDGTTGLGDGRRVSKTDIRVEAYGTVDEANAAIGVCIVACPPDHEIADLLRSVQHDMFDLGADLCRPIQPDEGEALRVTPAQGERLEREIDRCNDRLASLTSFVLPGGSDLAASLHVARTVVRRAERRTVELAVTDPEGTSGEPVRYLNRLSDLLFVLARLANDEGRQDVLWTPGANR